MLDAIVHTDVAQVNRVFVVVPGKEVRHVVRNEVAEGGREVVHIPDRCAHLRVGDVASIARQNTWG